MANYITHRIPELLIGPVRSARISDLVLLTQFSNTLMSNSDTSGVLSQSFVGLNDFVLRRKYRIGAI